MYLLKMNSVHYVVESEANGFDIKIKIMPSTLIPFQNQFPVKDMSL